MVNRNDKKNMRKEVPISLEEAKAITKSDNFDPYVKDIIKWLIEQNEQKEQALNDILDLDDARYLHRDPLDTNKVFDKARKLMKRKKGR